MLQLKDKWIWDFWLCQNGDEHHIFYLQAPKALGDERRRHFNATIGHARSSDLKSWTILPNALGPGKAGEWDDLATWTGCTLKYDDTWYLFYTGVNKAEKGLVQRVGVATSKDLIHWEKYSGNPVMEADPEWYELLDLKAWHDQAWRDPWIFRYEDQFHAFITARVNHGEPDGRGVIGHAVSDDLLHWKIGPPLTEPGDFGQLEVPQLIEVNSEPHLLFSTDKFTHAQALLDHTSRPAITGTASYLGETPLGPFMHNKNPWLFGDQAGSLYSGKFLQADKRGWTLMAFENYGEDGEFIGRIPDPFTVSPPK